MKLSKKVINASSFFTIQSCFAILFPIPANKIALGVDDEVLDVPQKRSYGIDPFRFHKFSAVIFVDYTNRIQYINQFHIILPF